MTDTTAAAAPPAARHRDEPMSVIIRPWPKVVFLYPTLVCATIFWFVQLLGGGGGGTEAAQAAQAGTEAAQAGTEAAQAAQAGTEAAQAAQSGTEATPGGAGAARVGSGGLGNIFFIVFAINLLLFSFDFSRIKSITILIGVVALVLGLGWADSTWGIAGGIRDVLSSIDIQMNTQFYGFTGAFLLFIMLLVLINTRFNYFEVNHREILHHHGYLGDITRMPTQGLRLNKEIYDLMEYLLLRSGRLIFYPSTSREAIVVDNVINVNRVETRIKDLLSVVAVRMTDEPD